MGQNVDHLSPDEMFSSFPNPTMGCSIKDLFQSILIVRTKLYSNLKLKVQAMK